MVKPIVYGAIGGGAAVVVAVVFLFAFHPATQQYALNVEPRTEMVMGVGNVIRVFIQNTGSSPLTNVKVDYGTTSDVLPILNAGEKQIMSPPTGTKTITVTTDQGITVMKSISDSMS